MVCNCYVCVYRHICAYMCMHVYVVMSICAYICAYTLYPLMHIHMEEVCKACRGCVMCVRVCDVCEDV